MTIEQKFVSVVAYIHNNENEIPHFLDTVMNHVAGMFSRCELILVNDDSTDGSLGAVHEYFDRNPKDYMVSIVKMGAFQGLESSMNAGRDLSIGDYVYEFDDVYVDYDLSVIREAYEKCIEGHDIVAVTSDAPTRFSSRLFYRIYNKASHAQNKIGPETFRILSRRAINRVKDMGSYIPYRKAVYMNCGLSTARIAYKSQQEGVSVHSNQTERTGLAMDSFIYFTNVMEKVSLAIAIAFFIIAIVVVIYVIVSLFVDTNLASGWVSMMGFLSIAFMGLFGMLTIVMKYLSVIVNLIFRKRRYLIEDVEKIAKN